jgi:hypothetical protein
MTQTWQAHALAYKAQGHSTRAVARGVNMPETTVRRFLQQHQATHGIRISFDRMIELLQADLKATQGRKEDNSRILFISDMHIPYHNPGMLEFLYKLKKRYDPTRVVCVGDELDKHALSFHDSDPDLDSAGKELENALPVIAEVEKMFPTMDLVDSNHGSMVFRKAHAHGIPRRYIRPYNEVLDVGPGWKWQEDMVLALPDGQQVYVCHGKTAEAIKTAQLYGMSHVCGHYHEKFGVSYFSTPHKLLWGMNTGCLIDNKSLAFAYNKVNPKRPIIGTGLIIDGVPIMEAMPL